MNVLEISELTKVFRDFWHRPTVRAVSSLSLCVRRGEVLGLLGPNGSGKSTTIKMILGLLRPTSGTIRYMLPAVSAKPPYQVSEIGRACSPNAPSESLSTFQPTDPRLRERIGYLPELSHLYHYLTPRETLRFYADLFAMPRARRTERIDTLLERVGLTEAADRAVGEFSKGMARRLGLAQALINDPDILILDEPTSGLDPLGRYQFKTLIAELAAQGKTILLSSHLLGEVEDVCTRVAILYDGTLLADGDLSNILVADGQRITLEDYFLRIIKERSLGVQESRSLE